MKKYLMTGAIVEAFIIGLRWIRGVSREVIKENKTNVFFWIVCLIVAIINAILWPLSIVVEMILVKNSK